METTNSAAIADYLVQAANISAPWRSTKYQIDNIAKIIHIWITRHPLPQVIRKRNWLGMVTVQSVAAAPPTEGPDLQWRHLNFMDYTCMIHTTDVLDERHHDLPWFGQTGLPFSNRLSRQVFMCLMEGMEMSPICTLLNIPYTDLWKFKFALDNGQVKFDYVPVKDSTKSGTVARTGAIQPDATQNMQASTTTPQAAGNIVPDVNDPLWESLITGTLNIQIKTLSFQLLLSKLRQQVSLQQTNDVKLMKLRELHRYVEPNARTLGHELQQLREHATLEIA